MKVRLFAVVAALLYSLMLSVGSSAQTGETRLLIGLAGKTPNERVQGIDINTAEIDRVLAAITLPPDIPVPNDFPTGFGDHFTRDLANQAFGEYRQVKQEIAAKLAVELLKVDQVRQVYALEVDADPLTVRLSQTGTAIHATVGSFSASVSAKVALPVCGTVTGFIDIEKVSARAGYDAFSGNIVGAQGSYDLTNVELSTGNPLKQLCIAAGKLIFGIDEREIIEDAINESLSDVIIELEETQLFSAEKFLISVEAFIRAYDPTIYDLTVPLPPISPEDIDAAGDAVAELRAFLGSFPGFSVQLNLQIKEGNVKEVSIIASHVATEIIDFEYYTYGAPMTLGLPARTEKVDVYSRNSSYVPWAKVATYNNGFNASSSMNTVWLSNVQDGQQFIAIGKNSLIGNLYGLPEEDKIFTYHSLENSLPLVYDTIGFY